MERTEIKEITDYIKELEKGLGLRNYQELTMYGHLNKLYEIIKLLMDATFKTEDKQLKVLLATLEYKARKCKQCIERRLAVKN